MSAIEEEENCHDDSFWNWSPWTTFSSDTSLIFLRYNPLHRSTLSMFLSSLQRRLLSTTTAMATVLNTVQLGLPALPYVPAAGPSCAVLDAFKVSIANDLPPLTVEQVTRVSTMARRASTLRLRSPASVYQVKSTCSPRQSSIRCVQSTNIYLLYFSLQTYSRLCPFPIRCRLPAVPSGRLRPVGHA